MRVYIHLDRNFNVVADIIGNNNKKIRSVQGEANILRELKNSSSYEEFIPVDLMKNTNSKVIVGYKRSYVIQGALIGNLNYEAFIETLNTFFYARAGEIASLNEYNKVYYKIIKDQKAYKKAQRGSLNFKKIACLVLAPVILTGAYKINSYVNKNISESDLNDLKSFYSQEYVQESQDSSLSFDNDLDLTIPSEEESQTSSIKEVSGLEVGTGLNETNKETLNAFMQSEKGEILTIVCDRYGLDPYFLAAICTNESSLGVFESESAMGEFQIENIYIGSKIDVYDVNKQEIVNIEITPENMSNFEQNASAASGLIQDLNEMYKENTILVSQGYNLGSGVVNLIIANLAEKTGLSKEEIINITDYSFFENDFKELSTNSVNYCNSLSDNLKENNSETIKSIIEIFNAYGTYGTYNYCELVHAYYQGDNIVSTSINRTIS